MRITFVTLKIDLAFGGGANRGLDIKLRNLQSRGHEVRLITIFPELNRLPADGVPYTVESVPCSDRTVPGLQRHVQRILTDRESLTDVYHLDGTTIMWAGGMYRLAGGNVPTVAYVPTYMEALNLLTYEPPAFSKGFGAWIRFHIDVRMVWLKHWVWCTYVGLKYARALDRLFYPSPISAERYARFGFPQDRGVVMPEFIETAHFRAETVPAQPLPEVFTSERPFRLLHVGRLLRMKGVDILIRAVAAVRAAGKHVALTVSGDGPQLERLKALTKKLGIADDVTFLPWTDESALGPIYASCDTFVHSCRFPEPLGRTIIEAMLFGRPIISTVGSGSTWAAGNAGVAARMGSVDDLARVIGELYDQPTKLAALSRATGERIQFFNVNHWTDVLEKELHQLTT